MKKDVAMQMFRDRVMCVGIDGGESLFSNLFINLFNDLVIF